MGVSHGWRSGKIYFHTPYGSPTAKMFRFFNGGAVEIGSLLPQSSDYQ
jgi:hypothetical protein